MNVAISSPCHFVPTPEVLNGNPLSPVIVLKLKSNNNILFLDEGGVVDIFLNLIYLVPRSSIIFLFPFTISFAW